MVPVREEYLGTMTLWVDPYIRTCKVIRRTRASGESATRIGPAVHHHEHPVPTLPCKTA